MTPYAAVPGYKPDICIYHDPCADGFTAAWAVQLRWPDCEMVPGRYGPTDLPNVAGKHVLLVDFSFKRPVLEQIAAEAASVTILDHHVSAQRDLEPLLAEGVVQGQFDMSRSGAMMAWQFCWPEHVENPFDGDPVDTGYTPYIVRYVQDRDLWTWQMPNAKEVCAWLNLQSLSFAAWNEAAEKLEDYTGFEEVKTIGEALVRKMEAEVGTGVRATQRRMVIGGYDVPVANLPHFLASDAGNAMCRGEPFAATYFDTADGMRSFSLRSDKDDPRAVDVSLIATSYGGGGHKNASGFSRPLGWEGDA